jgi:hypothetical protein
VSKVGSRMSVIAGLLRRHTEARGKFRAPHPGGGQTERRKLLTPLHSTQFTANLRNL